MKRKALSLLCVGVLLSGCSTNPNKAIEQEEKSAANSKVQFQVRAPQFQVILDKDDRILSICDISQQCGGLSGANNEQIYISNNDIGLGLYGTAKTACGAGFAVGHTGFIDFSDNRACHSKFYATSSMYPGQRVVFGVLTFGLWTLMTWSLHEKSFDLDSLRDTASNAHLHDLQNLLFTTDRKINSSSRVSVVYVDIDNIDNAYTKIINNPINADSIVLIDENTKKPLYVLNLGDYQDRELPVAVNLQFNDMLASLARHAVTSAEASLDVKKLIPPEISVPALPPVPQLTKSEYETKTDFNDRVRKAVTEREEAIRQLQQKYQRDVYNRNQYIVALGESWQQYLDGKASEQNKLIHKIKKNQTNLARLLYAINLGKFTAHDMSYDAESQSLYFTATSTHFGFKQKMMAKVSAPLAKSIKETGQYALAPKLLAQNDKIKMDGLTLAETSSGDDFATSYTDINFRPEAVSVKVATSSNKISKELSAIFKSYEQKPQAIVDTNTKEVWYIETVNRINAKIPDWFSTPEQSKSVIGYGVGNSHEEAMQSARKDLAYTVKTSISASMEILQQDNTFRSYQDVTQHTRAETDVELKAGDYSVYKQTESDGKYYVALCFHCNAN